MAATVEISESNGATPTVTDGISAVLFSGGADEAEAAPWSAITAGNNSYEKWLRVHLVSLGGSTSISNLRVWLTGTKASGDEIRTNARTTSYGGAESYSQPGTGAAPEADQNMPFDEPDSANLGIGGSLSGTLTAAGYSDYLVVQVQTDAGTDAATYRDLVLHVAYDEA